MDIFPSLPARVATYGLLVVVALPPVVRPRVPAAPAAVLGAMKDELARNFSALKAQPTPAYFLSYEITETHSVNVSSAFGAITSSGENRRRQLDLELRVGSY